MDRQCNEGYMPCIDPSGDLERFFMQAFFYRDIKSLQALLERIACKTNGGCCESYNYCKFCREPKCFVRKSDTPCAEAFLLCGENFVYCTQYADDLSDSYKKFVLYGFCIVNVRRILNDGSLSKNEYSLITDVPLQVGDTVEFTSRLAGRTVRVCRVNVPINETRCKVHELRHITALNATITKGEKNGNTNL